MVQRLNLADLFPEKLQDSLFEKLLIHLHTNYLDLFCYLFLY